ncbi:transporter substrate-binding domain-containing protein [Pseudonocardia endophytica]|uniref:Cyclohexadienyl dehydratase n=1 Tax=Pseudonocardia endophytica TaxID=401976 RepID=A0A4R1HP21_PSEEN|nr:transporter substrate-binding domain-containing protein [Pseudonocardia endophytica]TCK24277.1 cyclohexadienyl dehydratase [Pseudonocardia endophytica]
MRWWGPVFVAAACLLAGCGAGPSVPDRIKLADELRICSTGDYRPLTSRAADGTWSGIDVDMAHDLARDLGLRPVMVPTTWSTLLDDVTAGRCDIAVGGVSVTPDRAARGAFTMPYLSDGKSPIVRCPDVARYSTVEDIDRPGVRAVVNPGGTNERFAKERLTRSTLVEYPDNATIHDTLVDGRADVMVTDAIEARWQAAQRPGVLCAVHPDQPFTESEKAYLLPAGDPAFVERVNTWLRRALDDGTWQRFATPWLG